MIDIKFLKENPDLVKEGVKNKGRTVDIDKIIKLDSSVHNLNIQIDELRHLQKQFNKESVTEAKKNKLELKKLSEEQTKINKELQILLIQVPNLPADFVPIGTAENNKIIKKVGTPLQFDFKIKNHLELGQALDILDFKRATKISGSRFVTLKNQAVMLEMGLIKLVFEKLQNFGFDIILPPHLINRQAMQGMGYLEHGGEKETYYLENDELYLIGTSEHAIGSMYAGEVFDENDLPFLISAFSPCYRREAGSYGKDTKGMLRVHQFDKIEMFVFAKPEDSAKELDKLLKIEEEIVSLLKIPYQVVLIASGDLGDPAVAKYDIEAWMPGQNKYREITSTSNTTDFQSRRLNIKYKSKTGTTNMVHTLNGTAVAIGRMLIAIIENYQQSDGSILIPDILKPIVGFDKINPKEHK